MLRRIESPTEIQEAVDRGELRAGDVLCVPDDLLERMTPEVFAEFAGWLDYIGLAWSMRHDSGCFLIEIVNKSPHGE